jgi:hypothetical protein
LLSTGIVIFLVEEQLVRNNATNIDIAANAVKEIRILLILLNVQVKN